MCLYLCCVYLKPFTYGEDSFSEWQGGIKPNFATSPDVCRQQWLHCSVPAVLKELFTPPCKYSCRIFLKLWLEALFSFQSHAAQGFFFFFFFFLFLLMCHKQVAVSEPLLGCYRNSACCRSCFMAHSCFASVANPNSSVTWKILGA